MTRAHPACAIHGGVKLVAFGIVLLLGTACASAPPRKPVSEVALTPDPPAATDEAPRAAPSTRSTAEEPAPAPKPREDPGAAALESVRSTAIPAGFQISLERTACFGTCPAYTVTIRGNGDVSFVGSSPTAGCLKRTAPVTDVAKLVALVQAVDFFRLKPRYSAAGRREC